ncbi:hypothetical protein Q5752_006064 [Cryptotrichosporon argae]
MLRITRPLLSALKPLKASTDITGIAVHPDPLPALKAIYASTLSTLGSLPPTSVYRQATEALTKHRLGVVEAANGDVAQVERALGGIVEETLIEARAEQGLVAKMIEWKAWEPLSEEAPANQWRYFDPSGDSL